MMNNGGLQLARGFVIDFGGRGGVPIFHFILSNIVACLSGF